MIPKLIVLCCLVVYWKVVFGVDEYQGYQNDNQGYQNFYGRRGYREGGWGQIEELLQDAKDRWTDFQSGFRYYALRGKNDGRGQAWQRMIQAKKGLEGIGQQMEELGSQTRNQGQRQCLHYAVGSLGGPEWSLRRLKEIESKQGSQNVDGEILLREERISEQKQAELTEVQDYCQQLRGFFPDQ